MKYWGYGAGKTDQNVQEYPAAREAAAIVAFAKDLLDKANIEPEVYEIFKQKAYDENCQG